MQNRRADDGGSSDDEESPRLAQKDSDGMKTEERAESDGLGEKSDPLDNEVGFASLPKRLHNWLEPLQDRASRGTD